MVETKRVKYLGINLPKETKDLYTENYKTMIKARLQIINKRLRKKKEKEMGKILQSKNH